VRIAFCTLAASGHLNPMITLARRLRERGQDVFFAGIADCEPTVRAAGLEFHAFGEQKFPPGFRREMEAHLSKLHGLAGIRYTLQRFLALFEEELREAPRVLRESRAEAAVVDEVLGGFPLAAVELQLPLIHIANALPIHQYDSVPPPFTDWPYRTGLMARLRNRAGYGVLRYLLRPFEVVAEDHCRRHGLPFDKRDPNARLSKLARISQLPAAFDFPNPELPPTFHHTGPFHNRASRAEVKFPWDELTGQPLIYGSMGTVQNGAEHVFRTIAEACSNLGCQLVLSLGENVTREGVGPLPGNFIAVQHAPQLELLERAVLCITHAGLNTALESLAAGVPMVAIPITNDQPAVGARIVYTQTGIAVPYRRLDVERLRRAVRSVLEDERYRTNARRMQTAIREADGLERAAEIIEAALGIGGGGTLKHAAPRAR
jgi:MGT family glycosyltransferase